MTAFVMVDSDGYPINGGTRPVGRPLPSGTVQLPAPWATLDLPRLMLVDGTWQVRPQLPRAEASEFGFHLLNLPVETAIIAIRNLGTGSEDSFSALAPELWHPLPENSTFEIEVSGPRPWLSSSVTIVRGTGSPEVAAFALLRAKIVARSTINDAIGKTRLKYITDIPGQQTIYTEKQAEARAYLLAVPTPATLGEYPLLAGEIGVTAPTAWQLAQVWANKAVLFKQIAALTERLRMETSIAIDAATTEAGLEAVITASLTALSESPL